MQVQGSEPSDVLSRPSIGSTISRVVKWLGHAIREANCVQTPAETGGLFAAAFIFYPLSHSIAFTMIAINVGTYAVHIATNGVEQQLAPHMILRFQRLRGHIKVIKERIPIALMAAVAAGICLISWPMAILVITIIAVIRGVPAVSPADLLEKPEDLEFDSVPLHTDV
jgi:hypothetical protein